MIYNLLPPPPKKFRKNFQLYGRVAHTLAYLPAKFQPPTLNGAPAGSFLANPDRGTPTDF